MRLAKFLADAGIASRRAAEAIVQAGRVTVGGRTVRDPARDVGPADRVAVDGATVRAREERVVYALHKPPGVVSTARDPQDRPTVVSLIDSPRRLYPVGRLDIDASGLILLTDDGDLAHRLTHPSFEVEKTYQAVVANPPVEERALQALRGGVELEDGRTSPARARRIKADQLELVIHEGRNRQVKRMCEQVGHPVLRLTRTGFGPLALGNLRPGRYRALSPTELEQLRAASAGPAAGRS